MIDYRNGVPLLPFLRKPESNMHPWDIDNPASGPIEKFYLIKVHGAALRKAGYRDIERLSCAELRKAIAEMQGKAKD